MLDKMTEGSTVDDLNRFIYSAYFGVGLNYNITQRVGLRLLSTYDLPLKSLRKVNGPNDPSTYLHNVTISLGASYSF